MELNRDDIVSQLREVGHHDKAEKAENELPEKVDSHEHKGLLDEIGIDDSIVDKLPGRLADKELKDIVQQGAESRA
jgi:type II secretory pathway component PulK